MLVNIISIYLCLYFNPSRSEQKNKAKEPSIIHFNTRKPHDFYHLFWSFKVVTISRRWESQTLKRRDIRWKTKTGGWRFTHIILKKQCLNLIKFSFRSVAPTNPHSKHYFIIIMKSIRTLWAYENWVTVYDLNSQFQLHYKQRSIRS